MTELLTHSLDRIPIFPLPDTVLFPGAILPLHIFEERYKALTTDLLAGDRVLAIAHLRPGFADDYEGRPAIFPIVGVAYIVDSEELTGGRYNLLLRGIGRALLEQELPPVRPYRVARARRLIDTQTERPELMPVLHRQLVALCERLGQAMGGAAAELASAAGAIASPAACADVVGSAIVADAKARQALLDSLDPVDRIERVIDQLIELLADLGGSGGESLN